jgi:PIN domain nuclease of toxin-antitoxin system
MRLLLDTHLLIWASTAPKRLSSSALVFLENADNEIIYSVASLWEVAIKFSRGQPDFQIEPKVFREGLKRNEFLELPVLAEHAIAVAALPRIHKDPFDRLLVAQSQVEGVILLTADLWIAQYPGLIRRV